MKKTVYAFLALIMAAVFVNCEDEFGIRNTGEAKIVLEPEGAGYSLYFPYVAGKTWEYETIRTVTDDFPEGYPGGVDTTITDTSLSFDKVLFETELLGDTKIPVWKTWNFIGNETLYVHIEEYADFYRGIYHSYPWFSIPAIPEVGDTWFINYGEGGISTYRVVADNVEANGYDSCIRIRVKCLDAGQYEYYSNFEYWAPSVGKVKSEKTTVYVLSIPPYVDTKDSTIKVGNLTNEPAGIQE